MCPIKTINLCALKNIYCTPCVYGNAEILPEKQQRKRMNLQGNFIMLMLTNELKNNVTSDEDESYLKLAVRWDMTSLH